MKLWSNYLQHTGNQSLYKANLQSIQKCAKMTVSISDTPGSATDSFTSTHQYLIQKSSFGKSHNAKKKGQVAIPVRVTVLLVASHLSSRCDQF